MEGRKFSNLLRSSWPVFSVACALCVPGHSLVLRARRARPGRQLRTHRAASHPRLLGTLPKGVPWSPWDTPLGWEVV